jgi:hypothetical protein
VKGRPALEQIIHCLGEIVAARQLGPLLAQPDFEIGDQRCARFLPDRPAPFGALAIDRAFDFEQGVDARRRRPFKPYPGSETF